MGFVARGEAADTDVRVNQCAISDCAIQTQIGVITISYFCTNMPTETAKQKRLM
jgi:hypothetical protein